MPLHISVKREQRNAGRHMSESLLTDEVANVALHRHLEQDGS